MSEIISAAYHRNRQLCKIFNGRCSLLDTSSICRRFLDKLPEGKIDSLAIDSLRYAREFEKLEGAVQDRVQRGSFAMRIYYLVLSWLFCITALLLFQGFELCGFHLSDNVLIALITGASLNIIGLMAIVIRYLFSEEKARSAPNRNDS